MRPSIHSFIDDYAQWGDATAFAHRRGVRLVRWSYAQVAQTAAQFARELEARGIMRGERVLLRAENSAEWVAAFFGCVLRGVIVVPLDIESARDFVARVQQQTEAKLLLTDHRAYQLRDDAKTVEKKTGDEISAGSWLSQLPSLALDELRDIVARHPATPYPAGEIQADEIVEIIYTSGTTSEPRGVCLTHRNLIANLTPLATEIRKFSRWERLTVHPLRFLTLLPLSHVFGQFMGIFVPQLLGGEVHFQNSLNPSEIIETVRKQRISVVVTVPRLLDTLRESVERDYAARAPKETLAQALEAAGGWHFLRRWWYFRDVHRRFGWKFWAFISGGATLSAETERFWRRLGFAIIQGYGMTETASLITVNHPFKIGRGSIGKTLPGQEMKLDAHGEILVRGANVSPGYWQGKMQPLADPEGWLHTGDLGERDAEGNIYFKGRQKEMIVTAAGLNIYPADLEAALHRQPEVKMCTVVGMDTARSGTEPVAVLILRDPQQDPAPIIARANETLARHQQIRRWLIWHEPDFPRTPTHKIRQRAIIERINEEHQRSQASDEQGQAQQQHPAHWPQPAFVPHLSSFILSSVARISGETPAQLAASASLATDLKLDSLGRVELLSALQDHYQVEIDEAAFTAATTLGDIEKLVNEETGGGSKEAVEEARRLVRPYPYPYWTQRFPITWLRLLLLYAVVLPITFLLCWVRVRGQAHLTKLKSQSPVLFISNHITFIDHALILSALPGRFRRNFAIAMEGERLRHWRYPPDGTHLWTRLRLLAQYVLVVTFFNTFPLPQKSGFRRSFSYAGETMDRGYNVLVFPEGTRTVDGRLHPLMKGTGLLVSHLNVPVVPVRIEGLFELKAQGKHFFAPPGKVTLTFGEPVAFTPSESPATITAELQKRLASLGQDQQP